MMYEEFCDLTDFAPEINYYHEVIEPEYMRSGLNKQDLCKLWEKKGEIKDAYYTLADELYYAKKEIRNLQDEIARLNDLLKLDGLKTIV